MKFSRTETMALIAMAIVMCLTLVGAGGVVLYVASRPAMPVATAVVIATSIPTAVVQPTNTSSFPATWTPVPTGEPLPTPTRTPRSTSTPDLVPAYSREVVARVRNYRSALDKLKATLQQGADRPSLFTNVAWKAEVKTDLAELQLTGDELSNIPDVPQSYAEVDRWFKKVGPETRLMASDLIMGIDTMDSTYLDRVVIHIQNATTYMDNATNAR
jgi:hypothetical protein